MCVCVGGGIVGMVVRMGGVCVGGGTGMEKEVKGGVLWKMGLGSFVGGYGRGVCGGGKEFVGRREGRSLGL